MNAPPHHLSQNEVNSGTGVAGGTIESQGGQIIRPILTRGPLTVSSPGSGSPSANGRVLPVVYLKMQQREQMLPVVSRSGNIISSISPKISTAPSGNVSSSLSGNQSGFVTLQGPIRTVSQTSSSQASQPHIITLPKVANTLALSNQQLIALQSVSGTSQIGPVQQQQYVTIQAPIVSKNQQSSGVLSSSQGQPQYVTIRTPVLTPSGSGTSSSSQNQFVTIQAPVVQTGVQSTQSPTFLPVSSVGQTSASGKSPVTYQVLKSSVKAGDQHLMYPVSVSNIMPSTQSKMIFTPVTMMPKVSVVPAGTTSITVQSSSDAVANVGSISGIKLNASPQFSTKLMNNSTVSLLPTKTLQTISVRKEAVGLTGIDGSSVGLSQSKANSIVLPMGVSVSNQSSTVASSQGFINLTISNGHIQPSSSKGAPESTRVEIDMKLGKGINTLADINGECNTVPSAIMKENSGSSPSVKSSGLDNILVSSDEYSKQKLEDESDVIDIKSLLMSGTSNKIEKFDFETTASDMEEGKPKADIAEKTSESNCSTNDVTDLPEGPSSPINLFCEEGEITLSPPNEPPPPPKYTITMNSDEDIKIVKNDVLANESADDRQTSQKPLLKKTSPKLLSKGNSSSKGQSLLRNPAALSKPSNSKLGVKSILKPQSSKKPDIKTEGFDFMAECVGDALHSPGDSKDSMDALNSPLTPSSFEDFDAIAALEWKNGVGLLPGSNLKFRMNEFGLMEMVSDDDMKDKKGTDKETNSDSEGLMIDEGSNSSIEAKSNSEIPKDKKDSALDDVYCCETCNVYGLASEFLSERFCTQACSAAFTVKKAWQYRREQDLRALRLRRKKRRLEQQRQAREKAEEDIKIEDEKSEVSPMQKVLKKIKTAAPESMSDGDDSMEDPMSVDSHPPLSPTPSFNASDKLSGSHQMVNVQERDSLNEDLGKKSLKQKSAANFTWSKYLEMVKAKAAPTKLFKDPYPYLKNGFKVGMKLEGIDPEHPACFCVLTVTEVRGYRIRLHFDGYPDNYDFWVNADSPEIFQPGWCEKNLRRLTPPKGHSSFNWNAYLKMCKATAAPKFLFSKSSPNPVCPNGFRVGMKLEAVDRKNSSLVCVASIADIVDGRCLIHFDSWDDMYDYWADPSSPYIHPIGWCDAHGIAITPPNQYKDPSMFSWEKYLKETKTSPAPSRAFKQRQPCGFRRGMRIEAVDKRVPHLIRVATIDDVHEHQVRIRFDGWPDEYSYWVDDDSPDIHPPGWCYETKHPLEPPLSEEDMKVLAKCGVPGCKGEGHVKGARYTTHTTVQNCPYSPENLQQDSYLPDRLTSSNDHAGLDESSNTMLSDKEYQKSMGRPPRWKRLMQDADDKDPKRFRSRLSEDDNDSGEKPSLIASMQQKLQSELERSVVDPGYQIETGPGRPPLWAKHSQPLHESPVIRDAVNPRAWSIQEVIDFLSSIPCLEEYGTIFKEQDIDGESLLMLTQNELLSNMNLKLGHAIRLYNCIVILRQKCL